MEYVTYPKVVLFLVTLVIALVFFECRTYKTQKTPENAGVTDTEYSFRDNPNYSKRIKIFTSYKGQKDIVMLGNSLTERGNWTELLERKDVANRGIGSDITEGYIYRMEYVFNLHPKICFIEGGANDIVHNIPEDRIIKNLRILVDTLRGKEIKPVLQTVTLVTDTYQSINPKSFNKKIKDLNERISQLAKKKDVFLINMNHEITNGEYLLKKYAVEDGVHYNKKAYLIWKKKISNILQQI